MPLDARTLAPAPTEGETAAEKPWRGSRLSRTRLRLATVIHSFFFWGHNTLQLPNCSRLLFLPKLRLCTPREDSLIVLAWKGVELDDQGLR